MNRYDILGNEVYIGDEVIIIEPYYHQFVNAKIIKFTPKGFRVEYYKYSTKRFEETVVYSVVKGRLHEYNK